MFIGLLDPRWREQQSKTVDKKKQQDEIFAVDMYLCVCVCVCVCTCACACVHVNCVVLLKGNIFKTFSCINIIKGAQIGPSLKNLAERRTDIFGSEETVIGRKVHIHIYAYTYVLMYV